MLPNFNPRQRNDRDTHRNKAVMDLIKSQRLDPTQFCVSCTACKIFTKIPLLFVLSQNLLKIIQAYCVMS